MRNLKEVVPARHQEEPPTLPAGPVGAARAAVRTPHAGVGRACASATLRRGRDSTHGFARLRKRKREGEEERERERERECSAEGEG